MKLNMKEKITKETTMAAIFRRLGLFLAAALLTLACMPASVWGDRDRDGEYQQTNLVSDLPGVALLQDTNLVNAWGMSFSATSPFWISDNGSGLSTLYAVTYYQWHGQDGQTRPASRHSRRRQSDWTTVQQHGRLSRGHLHLCR